MVRVAVVGCTHGELDAIYDYVKKHNRSSPAAERVRFVICCGDFESLRNHRDLACKSCPPKYRHMNNFPDYYTGKKKAPILTIFVGGNHEASNYLRELFYGGWVAPNIFYLGTAGVINVAGVRIAGMSGIYSRRFYKSGFFEQEPFSKKNIDTLFLVREAQIFQLAHLATAGSSPRHVDVVLSHDWARNIENYGDRVALLEKRPTFISSIEEDRFGSPGSELLMSKLRPTKWLAGHMHIRFEARVPHDADGETTEFLGLSKCDPGVACVEIVDLPSASPPSADEEIRVMMDVEWLTILRKTHHLVTTERGPVELPSDPLTIEDGDLQAMRERISADFALHQRDRKGLVEGQWITEFSMTAPVDTNDGAELAEPDLIKIGNPQTDAILELLELPHSVTTPFRGEQLKHAAKLRKLETNKGGKNKR